MLAYQEEFTDEYGDAFGSPLYHVSKNTDFSFYHYQSINNNGIKHPQALLELDKGFSFSYCQEPTNFSSDAKLFRGCVRLSR